MISELRLPFSLYTAILADLHRPHPFAFERVSFVYGTNVSTNTKHSLVLLHSHQSIPDNQYLHDHSVGACIGQDAISSVMYNLHNDQEQKKCVFHVHCHNHIGEPLMSVTDADELSPLIPGFRAVAPNGIHGILILSRDHAAAWTWLPRQKEATPITRISVIGAPIRIFEGGKLW